MKELLENKRPIGAVVRAADQLFTKLSRKTSQDGSFDRLEWQFFNLLKERKCVKKAEVMEFLNFFDSGPFIQSTIDRFQREGLLIQGGDGMQLSPKGEEVFEEVAEAQEKIKDRSMQGISPEAYDTTLETLQKISGNLQEFVPAETKMELVKSLPSIAAYEYEIEEGLIKELIARMEQAHNAKDPNLLASLFAKDAAFVNAAGVRLRGREAIYGSAKKAMETFMAKSYARYLVSRIFFIKEDIAIAEIEQYPVIHSGELMEKQVGGLPTYVLSKNTESGNWQIICAQNTLVVNA